MKLEVVFDDRDSDEVEAMEIALRAYTQTAEFHGRWSTQPVGLRALGALGREISEFLRGIFGNEMRVSMLGDADENLAVARITKLEVSA